MSTAHEHLAKAQDYAPLCGTRRSLDVATMHALISIAASLAGPEPAQHEQCPQCGSADLGAGRGRRNCYECGEIWRV